MPDPTTRGPAWIQIGNEGGFLPAPTVLPNQPVVWNMDPTMFNVGNVLQQNQGGGTLFVAPAERADVIVDFTNYAGKTLILYNDAPTAFPALVPQYDYYTGAPDRTGTGGYGPVLPGVGPNVRTVMQITIAGSGGTPVGDDFDPAYLATLQTAFASNATTPGVFKSSQEDIIVGQGLYTDPATGDTFGTTAYNKAYNTTFSTTPPFWGIYSDFSSPTLSFQRVDGTTATLPLTMKAMHDEMGGTFDDYGRMSAKLGIENPFANAGNANFIMQQFVDGITEITKPGEVQIWRVNHNGVDTHPIHFHLFEVQLINRIGWDGFVRLPDPNEIGWKDTVRISPLEDTIVALRPVLPDAPFKNKMPNSVRPLNPTTPIGSTDGFSQVDIRNGGALTPLMTNQMVNFGWEYTWHCHILSHEENDMMRPIAFAVPPAAPTGLGVTIVGGRPRLAWTDNSVNETAFTIQRAATSAFTTGLVTFSAGPNVTAFTDTSAVNGQTYSYRVLASNTVGGPAASFYPVVVADSGFSNPFTITVGSLPTPAAPSNLRASTIGTNFVILSWTDNATNEQGFYVERSPNGTTGWTRVGTTAANSTLFRNLGLTTGTTYFYRVQAFNASGVSAYSNVFSVTTR